MRVLVTGGAGFIGANFVHHTVAHRPDVAVTVLDALTYAGDEASLGPVSDRIEFVRGDIADAALVDRLVGAADLVVHFAAESHNDNSLRDPGPFVHTNLVGTFTILEAVRKHGVRLHHISTDEVFGDLELDDPAKFTADTPYNPSSPYSSTKAGSDLLVRAWVRSFERAGDHLELLEQLRPVPAHREVHPAPDHQCARRSSAASLYGAGANVRDWIHVDDHNAAVWTIIEQGRVGRDLSHRRGRRAQQPRGARDHPGSAAACRIFARFRSASARNGRSCRCAMVVMTQIIPR